MSWYWKEIDDKYSAEDATKAAVGISYFVAGLTTLLAVLSLVYAKPIFGASGSSLVDAILFFLVAWRMRKLSRAWTIIGLVLYILEAVYAIGTRGGGIGVLTIVFIIAYVNAVRGVFAYHKYQASDQETLPQEMA